MTEIIYIATSLWLGILTAISPCPLASNIAAVSFVSRSMKKKHEVILSGLFYTLGRSLCYTLLGFLIVKMALNIPFTANFLQRYMIKILGPLFFITGIFLIFPINIFPFFLKLPGGISRIKADAGWSGFAGSLILGFVLALAFCPISAALYFGSLIPLSLKAQSGILLPAVYGIGTGLPVFVCAVIIASGASYLEKFFDNIKKIEEKSKLITGIVLLLIGIYMIIKYL